MLSFGLPDPGLTAKEQTMTRPNTPISPLRARMLEDLALRKLEPKTQASYIRAVEKLSAFLKRSPATAAPFFTRLAAFSSARFDSSSKSDAISPPSSSVRAHKS